MLVSLVPRSCTNHVLDRISLLQSLAVLCTVGVLAQSSGLCSKFSCDYWCLRGLANALIKELCNCCMYGWYSRLTTFLAEKDLFCLWELSLPLISAVFLQQGSMSAGLLEEIRHTLWWRKSMVFDANTTETEKKGSKLSPTDCINVNSFSYLVFSAKNNIYSSMVLSVLNIPAPILETRSLSHSPRCFVFLVSVAFCFFVVF